MEGDDWSQSTHRNFVHDGGHTKFAPDWCFGLLKQKFRKTKVGCLDDIVKVVNDSSVVNHAQLVGKEDGTIIVPQYDWATLCTILQEKCFSWH